MPTSGQNRKSSVGLGMSVAGGEADVISTKADIVPRLSLSERCRHASIGARSVVTVPAWRASAERPDFLAGMEGRNREKEN